MYYKLSRYRFMFNGLFDLKYAIIYMQRDPEEILYLE